MLRHLPLARASSLASLLVCLFVFFSPILCLGLAPGGSLPSNDLDNAPILRVQNRTSVVQGSFIVQVSTTDRNTAIQAGLPALFLALTGVAAPLPIGVSVSGQVSYSYDTALIGFAIKLTVSTTGGTPLPGDWTIEKVINEALQALAAVDGVLQIEEDAQIFSQALENQPTDYWHLDRVDQRPLKRDNKYYYNTTADNVHAYVIDTGIRKSHEEFEGRADWVYSAFAPAGTTTYNAEDDQGHGTHVAGTIGSRTFGLAKKVKLHAVKVLDSKGSGSDSTVVAGVDWVARNRILPAVAVMSLGGGISSSLDTAVKNAVQRGVVVVAAAGNSNADACGVSPAHVDVIITVSASDQSDARASFSNWGTCSTLFAPGLSITSLSNADNTGYATMSGTSMAAPHVAGAAAIYLAQHPDATPAVVKRDLICFSTKNAVSDPANTPNRLMFTFTNQNPQDDPSSGGGAGGFLPSTDPSAAPSGNNQNEQCTSSSPCSGPYSATLTSAAKSVAYAYNFTGPGLHRAWLNYNNNAGGLLTPVRNKLELYQYSDATRSWQVVASATDSNNAKNVMFEDSTSASDAASTWAWVVTAQGATPSAITLSYKLPSAPGSVPPPPPPAPADPCSATRDFDPNPDNPNNAGQDPNGRGNGAEGKMQHSWIGSTILAAIAIVVIHA